MNPSWTWTGPRDAQAQPCPVQSFSPGCGYCREHGGRHLQLVADKSSEEGCTFAVGAVRPSSASGMGRY